MYHLSARPRYLRAAVSWTRSATPSGLILTFFLFFVLPLREWVIRWGSRGLDFPTQGAPAEGEMKRWGLDRVALEVTMSQFGLAKAATDAGSRKGHQKWRHLRRDDWLWRYYVCMYIFVFVQYSPIPGRASRTKRPRASSDNLRQLNSPAR